MNALKVISGERVESYRQLGKPYSNRIVISGERVERRERVSRSMNLLFNVISGERVERRKRMLGLGGVRYGR